MTQADTAPDASHNQFAYSVGEISQALKRLVEDNFGSVRVRGEISGWKVASSGHAYLKLKDENAVLDACCWKGVLGKMPFKPEDGMEVICTGRITTYPGRSNYQIVIEFMEPAGAGALMALLEKRKKQLLAEGLFDSGRKKPLPFMPRVIGVITSPTGAVIRDILHRLADRFPSHVLVWPVLVQGEGAAEQVARAIAGFNAIRGDGGIPRPDLLIVARGGGSLEDLWAFNEEIVVRTAAASDIVLISAVGHETDTTLIDYASDRRAPTPTAAAEMAVPVLQELRLLQLDLHKRLHTAHTRGFAARGDSLANLARALPHPRRNLELAAQRLDDWSERLRLGLPKELKHKEHQLQTAAAKLQVRNMAQNVERYGHDIAQFAQRANAAAHRFIQDRTQKLAHMQQLLRSVDYMRVLERGFALVKNADGKLVTQASAIASGETLCLTFKDGTRTAKAT